jgi:hypothetical protein
VTGQITICPVPYKSLAGEGLRSPETTLSDGYLIQSSELEDSSRARNALLTISSPSTKRDSQVLHGTSF